MGEVNNFSHKRYKNFEALETIHEKQRGKVSFVMNLSWECLQTVVACLGSFFSIAYLRRLC